MAEENLQHDERTVGIKLQFDALLAEYKMLREATASRRQMQGQLDNIALVGLGATVPLVLAILTTNPDSIGAVLLIPILFFAIAFAQIRHERQLILDSMYIDANLRPKANGILSQLSGDDIKVFEYERFLTERSWIPSLVLKWIATASRGGISLVVGTGLIVLHICLVMLLNLRWNPYQTWLTVMDALVLIGVLLIALFAARISHSYLKITYSERQRAG
jgi:hypothetical protein